MIIKSIVQTVFLLIILAACTSGPVKQSIQKSEGAIPDMAPVNPDAAYDPNFKFDYPMIPVKGGAFTMGCTNGKKGCDANECPHPDTVGDFQLGRLEVTQTQWISVMGDNPSGFSSCLDCPVEHISWLDAKKFINKLNAITGRSYRLPTEAEWEYAARGGPQADTKANYIYAGAQHANLDKVAWYNANSEKKTHPVGTKAPNALGLHDMSGNVHEWCEDLLRPYKGCPGKSSLEVHRVGRGGSWNSTYYACRVSGRMGVESSVRYLNMGLRLAHN
jgi:formylglycine-generating enzyme